MVSQISTFGALVGLILAIILIIKKVHPAYSLILGALVGGVIGGAGLAGSVSAMVTGAQGMMSPVLRIMTSGILAGALIKTGSAETIAETIVKKLGEKRAVAAIAIATMIICAVGVFIDIAVITVAPIAIAIAKKADLSKAGILLAMIGGGKAGNIISPNPNTIAASEAFQLDLTALMAKNIIPALVALVVSILLAGFLAKKVDHAFDDMEEDAEHHTSVPFFQAILGPVVVIALLALRSLVGVSVDYFNGSSYSFYNSWFYDCFSNVCSSFSFFWGSCSSSCSNDSCWGNSVRFFSSWFILPCYWRFSLYEY